MKSKDNVFIVTGAASGLGLSVAEMLAAEGAKVVAADRDADKVDMVADRLGGSVCAIGCDVTGEDDGAAAVSLAVSEFGRLDGLINCAGVAPGEKIVGSKGPHRLETFTQTVSINLVGTFNMLRLAAAEMSRNSPGPEGERGVIVNTASIAAIEGQIGQAAYAASKAGVAALSLPAARELAPHGIRVAAIAPGIFATPIISAMPFEVQESLAANIPFPQRLGRPQEFASLVSHIIANPMINGEVIRLDGALRMAPR